ncbi:unnamed protein product [Mytilus edulis]|uniref:Uncharacterized protein n=1 Tax=Mytilus edulis TaxID=6550 RepID=A0A8S3T159_MYTED|nr:unnamed protein product [Mytilus edulis]
MSRSLRRVGMPCRYVVPRLEHYGMKPEPDQELISVTSPDLPINYHLEHLEPVVPRVRLFSVMIHKPAIIQIADGGEIVEVEPAHEELSVLDVRIYADIQMSRSLRRVGMPCRYVVPRLEHYGMEPEPEPIPVTSHEMTINYHLEHFEAVVPRVRLFSVMVPKPANIQIAK